MKQFFLIPSLLLIGVILFISCVHETNYNSVMDACDSVKGCWNDEKKTCERCPEQK